MLLCSHFDEITCSGQCDPAVLAQIALMMRIKPDTSCSFFLTRWVVGDAIQASDLIRFFRKISVKTFAPADWNAPLKGSGQEVQALVWVSRAG